jgi:hypothetical protein
MTLIYHDKTISGPATHALIIGVGYYAHLPGGKGKLIPDHQGMEQLTSPPYSAREFAAWLRRDYYNPEKPLATIDMLVSEPDASVFIYPGENAKPVERATFARVKQALLAWFQRGDQDPQHQLILFFCGHGVSRGHQSSLLMEDFGKIPNNPLEHALSFRDFYEGMDTCKARQQCFFIDACRVASPALIMRYANYTGQPVIPGSAFLAQPEVRAAPIFYATVPGQPAYGRSAASSVFTDALLKALKGSGCIDANGTGTWLVSPFSLSTGLDSLLRWQQENLSGIGQMLNATDLAYLTLHFLKGDPIVPVSIGCKPSEANQQAELGYTDPQGAQILRGVLSEQNWVVDLGIGDYDFFANFPAGGYKNEQKKHPIAPPCRKVLLEVAG